MCFSLAPLGFRTYEQYHFSLTQDTVSCERLGLRLEVFDVVHLSLDDGPEASIFVVVLQVGFTDERNLLVVFGALSCEEGSCHSRKRASYILHRLQLRFTTFRDTWRNFHKTQFLSGINKVCFNS